MNDTLSRRALRRRARSNRALAAVAAALAVGAVATPSRAQSGHVHGAASVRLQANGAALTPSARNALSITTTDKGYTIAGTAGLRPGWVEITLANKDKAPHQAQLVKVPTGQSADAFFAKLRAEPGPTLGAARFDGGPTGVNPGSTRTVANRLEAGTYAVLDLMPGPDGAPNMMRGYAASFTVSSKKAVSARPAHQRSVLLHDFFFSGDLTLRSGTRLAITNDGAQPHELGVVRLNDGVTADQFVAWMLKPQGPPPFTESGGVAAIASKATAVLPVEFRPGTYAVFCMVPDPKTGKPHIALGMVANLTIS